MKHKIDRILSGTLWLLICALGANFWLTIKYGFNIFSGQHWQYLSYLQASHSKIETGFYVSLFLILFIYIFGLYLLVRPRFKKIRLPEKNLQNKTNPEIQNNAPTQQNAPAMPATSINIARPPRLTGLVSAPPPTQSQPIINPNQNSIQNQNLTNGPSALGTSAFTPPAPQINPAPVKHPTTPPDNSVLERIFETAGYKNKKSPRIKGLPMGLFAIGNNETVWIGAQGISLSKMQTAYDNLNQVFLDTLEDIYINLNAFVISPIDTDENAVNVLTLSSIDALEKYMQSNQSEPIESDMQENFDAFSEYIDTVIKYIGNI